MVVYKAKVGRPTKYKFGRALTATERKKAERAKKKLATVNLTSSDYQKYLKQLETLYSKNPNQQQTELINRFGRRVDIHGFGWKDTDEYKGELKQDRY